MSSAAPTAASRRRRVGMTESSVGVGNGARPSWTSPDPPAVNAVVVAPLRQQERRRPRSAGRRL